MTVLSFTLRPDFKVNPQKGPRRRFPTNNISENFVKTWSWLQKGFKITIICCCTVVLNIYSSKISPVVFALLVGFHTTTIFQTNSGLIGPRKRTFLSKSEQKVLRSLHFIYTKFMWASERSSDCWTSQNKFYLNGWIKTCDIN